MRVLQVIDIGWLAGGAEQSVKLLRDRLRRRGHDVVVLATDKNADGQSVFADVLIPHIRGSAMTRIARFAFYRTAYREMRRTIDSFNPDVIHFHTIGELSPAALYAARDVPHVLTVHGPEDFTLDLLPWHLPASDYRQASYQRRDLKLIGRLRLGYLRLLQRPIYLWFLRHCFALVAPSRFMATALAQDSATDRIEQIYNGIDLPMQRWPREGTHLLYVGRLEAVKGVDVLLRSFAASRARQGGARLTIVGDGDRRDDLMKLTAELGLVDRVTFTGWVPAAEVRHHLEAATAVVIPSVWPENLPTVALEAIGIGRPIVGTTTGGIPELIEDGTTGLLVQPYDVDGLTAAIDHLADNPAEARRMGRQAREKARLFDVDAFVKRVVGLYEQACAA